MNYCEPHKKSSREVTENDVAKVLELSDEMIALCHKRYGLNTGAFAIAHSQIDDQDPMTFFVTHDGEIIINPKITRHTNTPIKKLEGCMSFPMSKPIIVERWNKCEVEFQTVEDGKLTEVIKQAVSGRTAEVFQHEIIHFSEPFFIYEKEFDWEASKAFIKANQPKQANTTQDLSSSDGEVRGEMPTPEVRSDVTTVV